MEYVTLGKSDLRVSRICMGCMGFGNAATGQHSWTVDEETSKSIIRRSLDASLSHLGMEYVDLYIYHMWDWDTPVEEYLAGMAEGVKAGKIRQIGISNCFAWQLAEANAIAKENGWPEFVSVQNHYNLIMREEEREMNVYAAEKNIALTPYSALAAGRLSRSPGETTKRLEQDSYAKLKYDAAFDRDAPVIARVSEIADAHNVSMTEVSLAWLLTRVTSPVVGATKISHVEGAAGAVDLKLSADEIKSLEEFYVPHFLSGVMAQNTPAARNTEQVWIQNGKYIRQE